MVDKLANLSHFRMTKSRLARAEISLFIYAERERFRDRNDVLFTSRVLFKDFKAACRLGFWEQSYGEGVPLLGTP